MCCRGDEWCGANNPWGHTTVTQKCTVADWICDIILDRIRYSQCCYQGLKAGGQKQGQGLEVWAHGQGLINWSSRILEDKDLPRGQQPPNRRWCENRLKRIKGKNIGSSSPSAPWSRRLCIHVLVIVVAFTGSNHRLTIALRGYKPLTAGCWRTVGDWFHVVNVVGSSCFRFGRRLGKTALVPSTTHRTIVHERWGMLGLINCIIIIVLL